MPSLAQVPGVSHHLSIHLFFRNLITDGYILNIVRVTQAEGHVSEMRSISTTKSSRVRYTCSKEWFYFVLRSFLLLSQEFSSHFTDEPRKQLFQYLSGQLNCE